jgi:aromatic-amino-acid transaminase
MSGLFSGLEAQPADGLLRLIVLFRDDPRPGKIDLGVGIYRDDDGATPVLKSVKAAERILLETQDSKSYLGPDGDVGFVERLEPIVFGNGADTSRLSGVQTPGGTGALRLAAELIARARPGARIWTGTPTWPNHAPIFEAAGLDIAPHPFFDPETQRIEFAAMMNALEGAEPGDTVLVHGSSHNPTGAELDEGQAEALAELIVRRGLVPLIDLAYQGLGHGLEEDAQLTRLLLAACDEALIAYSCDKNFGLYRERVGALWVQAPDAQAVDVARQNMLVIARGIWSMPPDHGAAIVRVILEREDLTQMWREELDEMRDRISGLRQKLADSHPLFAGAARQTGMFALLPLSPEAVAELREMHGIYMAGNGRINIAGLTDETVDVFVAAAAPLLRVFA